MSVYKPSIGIDIDGVIGDSDKTFRKYINKFFGFNLKQQDVIHSFYEKVLGIPKKKMTEFWDYFDEKNKWLEIPVLSGARTSLDYLKEKYQIILITARPKKAKEQTLHWLAKNKIPYDKIYFVQEYEGKSKLNLVFSKGLLLKCVIEDRIDFAMEFIKEKIKVLLFDYPWNQLRSSKPSKNLLIRIKGWREVLSYL
ncbi:MAG: hypothetical protein JW827_00200 [Spirochaetes bacterium]|nr:hypothetical protein [Spirochaetota bacterium]